MPGRVLVAGGGISGLATALVLSRHGHEVVVLERRPEFSELGAGIQLAPNAFRALDRLGVGDRVRRRSVFVDALVLMDALREVEIVRLDLGDRFRARYGGPYAVVHRNDLYAPLLQLARRSARIELRSAQVVQGYHRSEFGVAALLASNDRVAGDALIGADGLRSAIRAQLVGDGAPRVSGHTIYRSVVPMADVPGHLRWNAATLWAGPGYHLVHYPIAGTKSFNLAFTVDNGATEEVVGVAVPPAKIRELVAGVDTEVARRLALGRDWRSWVLCDRDPVRTWTDGPVALIGDAAHPMLQYAAQGAAMALEDAVSLDTVLRDTDDFATAFKRWEISREQRTARVQLVSRRIGDETYHAAGHAARERDEMLSALSVDDKHRMLDWLYAPEEATVS